MRRGGSYIDSTKWIKNKKGTINPKDDDDKCIIYAIIALLSHDKIDNHPKGTLNLKSYINDIEYGLEFPVQSSDWKKLKKIINQLLLIFCLYLMVPRI